MTVYVLEGKAGVIDVYTSQFAARNAAGKLVRAGEWAQVTKKVVKTTRF